MSVNVDRRVVPPGDDEYLERAWRLKERIRTNEGVLRQRRSFFRSAYTRSTVYIYVDEIEGELIGFATVRRDGYILFLAVDGRYREQGFGERLVASAAEDHDSVTCHARATNEGALVFYEKLGFETERRIESYYEDGGDAFYLRLGDQPSIRDRLARLLRR